VSVLDSDSKCMHYYIPHGRYILHNIIVYPFRFHASKDYALFGFLIFRLWAYLMKGYPETRMCALNVKSTLSFTDYNEYMTKKQAKTL